MVSSVRMVSLVRMVSRMVMVMVSKQGVCMRERLALELTEVAWMMCTLNEIVQGRLREDKKTYAIFLDIQKAYNSVWHDGLWYKLWAWV